jgi:CAAX prenyl protease-like protein
MLVAIAAGMLTRAFTDDFDRLYPLRVVAVGGSLWAFRGVYARLRWDPSWQAVAIGVVAFFSWIGLTSPPEVDLALSDPRIGLAGTPDVWRFAWLCFRIMGSVITAPLAEELAFRAYLTRRLIAADYSTLPLGTFSWPSCLVSSAVFGLLHGSWFAGTVAGMLFALALYRRGRVADAILAHATTNACLAAYVVTTGNWWLWN